MPPSLPSSLHLQKGSPNLPLQPSHQSGPPYPRPGVWPSTRGSALQRTKVEATTCTPLPNRPSTKSTRSCIKTQEHPQASPCLKPWPQRDLVVDSESPRRRPIPPVWPVEGTLGPANAPTAPVSPFTSHHGLRRTVPAFRVTWDTLYTPRHIKGTGRDFSLHSQSQSRGHTLYSPLHVAASQLQQDWTTEPTQAPQVQGFRPQCQDLRLRGLRFCPMDT